MSTKSIYVTLRYDPRKSGPTDELAALVDAAALGLPPPLSGPGPEHLNAHSVRFLWIPPPPAQEARRMYDEWGGIWAAADPAQTIRAQVVGVAARQRTDEKQRKVMKERGIIRIEWFEKDTPGAGTATTPVKRAHGQDDVNGHAQSKRPRTKSTSSSSVLQHIIAATNAPATPLSTPPPPLSSLADSSAASPPACASTVHCVSPHPSALPSTRPSPRPLEDGEIAPPSLPTPPYEPDTPHTTGDPSCDPSASLAPVIPSRTPPALPPYITASSSDSARSWTTARERALENELTTLRTAHAVELQAARDELKRTTQEAGRVRSERDALQTERDELQRERDGLRAERDANRAVRIEQAETDPGRFGMPPLLPPPFAAAIAADVARLQATTRTKWKARGEAFVRELEEERRRSVEEEGEERTVALGMVESVMQELARRRAGLGQRP